ncbi:putative glyoxalase [Kordia algicida OT-1]|uniref:Putative glyoxalase n=1 Tax=Kordia algicida OT-1 TaxID=391587 RepID=A9DY98_9FLAO|nr:VOC family protein [Kordia algicida]EDP96103.1 putative glyoxalase [Kordia algicida OT-1]
MVSWFEIPVIDMNRAQKFYETVFKVSIRVEDFGGLLYGWFPPKPATESCTGALVKQESYVPSKTDGVLVYFASEDVANELAIILKAGGTVVQGKTQISPETGYMAVFVDTEGNRIALFSRA